MSLPKESRDTDGVTGGMLRGIAIVVVLLWVVLHTATASVRMVNAGFVEVVYQFGGIVGQREEGLQLIAPWQDTVSWDTRVQKIRPETTCGDKKTPECLEAFSKETQDVFIKPTLNLRVSKEAIQLLARTVGVDYVEKLVRPRLQQIFKDATVAYLSVEIAPNREEIRVSVRERLKKELDPWSITVEDLLVDNMDFREEFKIAIEAKQIASQEALRQKELIAAKEAEAKQKAAEAQGNADKLRIEAEGQAKANDLISRSLTPALIQFQAVQKLGPNVQIALIPSGQGIIIDPATLFGQMAPATR
ncbi:MAG: prohibitin family protein [Candidatus Berkelbacteria bacterium]|nr:prohibitin family protein [Candidatus Berkelbacteria bacterium]